jgi:hypothetical protein
LQGTAAKFDDGNLRARIDLLRPLDGLCALSFSGQTFAGDERALGVDVGKVSADDVSLPETYARVDDLVATYRQTETRPFRLQAYWRRVRLADRFDGRATAIELQISINTSLLDTHPAVRVTSCIAGSLAAAPASASAERRYSIVRTAGGAVYWEAVHPSDERPAHGEATREGGVRTHALFGDFLEKGVIVRARIRGAFLPASTTEADLDGLYDEFVREPLPLTT